MCRPSGSVTISGEPSTGATAAGGVDAIVSVGADTAGAPGLLFLLQADMARAVSAARVISRPWVMNVSFCAGVRPLTVDPCDACVAPFCTVGGLHHNRAAGQ